MCQKVSSYTMLFTFQFEGSFRSLAFRTFYEQIGAANIHGHILDSEMLDQVLYGCEFCNNILTLAVGWLPEPCMYVK